MCIPRKAKKRPRRQSNERRQRDEQRMLRLRRRQSRVRRNNAQMHELTRFIDGDPPEFCRLLRLTSDVTTVDSTTVVTDVPAEDVSPMLRLVLSRPASDAVSETVPDGVPDGMPERPVRGGDSVPSEAVPDAGEPSAGPMDDSEDTAEK